MELVLSRHCGKAAQLPVTMRCCTPQEAEQIFALQNQVRAGMAHPEQFVPDDLASIEKDIREGIAVGVWHNGQMMAYAVIHFCGMDPHNYAAFLGVPQAEWPHWANGNSAVVHPDLRGNGLQQTMLNYAMRQMPPQITHIAATVSPANQYSLRNMQALGFEVRLRREMYGGYDRYLLAKTLPQKK